MPLKENITKNGVDLNEIDVSQFALVDKKNLLDELSAKLKVGIEAAFGDALADLGDVLEDTPTTESKVVPESDQVNPHTETLMQGVQTPLEEGKPEDTETKDALHRIEERLDDLGKRLENNRHEPERMQSDLAAEPVAATRPRNHQHQESNSLDAFNRAAHGQPRQPKESRQSAYTPLGSFSNLEIKKQQDEFEKLRKLKVRVEIQIEKTLARQRKDDKQNREKERVGKVYTPKGMSHAGTIDSIIDDDLIRKADNKELEKLKEQISMLRKNIELDTRGDEQKLLTKHADQLQKVLIQESELRKTTFGKIQHAFTENAINITSVVAAVTSHSPLAGLATKYVLDKIKGVKDEEQERRNKNLRVSKKLLDTLPRKTEPEVEDKDVKYNPETLHKTLQTTDDADQRYELLNRFRDQKHITDEQHKKLSEEFIPPQYMPLDQRIERDRKMRQGQPPVQAPGSPQGVTPERTETHEQTPSNTPQQVPTEPIQPIQEQAKVHIDAHGPIENATPVIGDTTPQKEAAPEPRYVEHGPYKVKAETGWQDHLKKPKLEQQQDEKMAWLRMMGKRQEEQFHKQYDDKRKKFSDLSPDDPSYNFMRDVIGSDAYDSKPKFRSMFQDMPESRPLPNGSNTEPQREYGAEKTACDPVRAETPQQSHPERIPEKEYELHGALARNVVSEKPQRVPTDDHPSKEDVIHIEKTLEKIPVVLESLHRETVAPNSSQPEQVHHDPSPQRVTETQQQTQGTQHYSSEENNTHATNATHGPERIIEQLEKQDEALKTEDSDIRIMHVDITKLEKLSEKQLEELRSINKNLLRQIEQAELDSEASRRETKHAGLGSAMGMGIPSDEDAEGRKKVAGGEKKGGILSSILHYAEERFGFSILKNVGGAALAKTGLGKMLGKIPGVGKYFKGAGSATEAAEGASTAGKVAEEGGIVGKILGKIPGMSKIKDMVGIGSKTSQAAEGVGATAEGVGGASKIFGTAEGASKVAGVAGEGAEVLGVAGKLGKFAGKASGPLAAIMAVVDGIQGYNNASKLTGVSDDKLSTKDRLGSAGAGVIGGALGIPGDILDMLNLNPTGMLHVDNSDDLKKTFAKGALGITSPGKLDEEQKKQTDKVEAIKTAAEQHKNAVDQERHTNKDGTNPLPSVRPGKDWNPEQSLVTPAKGAAPAKPTESTTPIPVATKSSVTANSPTKVSEKDKSKDSNTSPTPVSSREHTPTSEYARIGSMSAKGESGGNAGAINSLDYATNQDKGGRSYGLYQITSGNEHMKGGIPMEKATMTPFLKFLSKAEPDMAKQLEEAGGAKGAMSSDPKFIATWKNLAKDPKFADAQHEFIGKQAYEPLKENASKFGLDIDKRSDSVKKMMWEAAVGGVGNTQKVMNDAFKDMSPEQVAKLDDAEVIKRIQGRRADTEHYGYTSYDDKSKRAVHDRFSKEEGELLTEVNQDHSPQRIDKPAMAGTGTKQADIGGSSLLTSLGNIINNLLGTGDQKKPDLGGSPANLAGLMGTEPMPQMTAPTTGAAVAGESTTNSLMMKLASLVTTSPNATIIAPQSSTVNHNNTSVVDLKAKNTESTYQRLMDAMYSLT